MLGSLSLFQTVYPAVDNGTISVYDDRKAAKGLDFQNKLSAQECCPYAIAAEQKARVTYDNILRLSDDPDVSDVIKFLRAREIVHFQRFGEALQSR